MIVKVIEVEALNRKLQITLIEIFCKIILNFKFVIKITIDPVNNF